MDELRNLKENSSLMSDVNNIGVMVIIPAWD